MNQSVEQALLSLYPPGTEVLDTQSYRPGYLAYPMRVRLRTPDGRTEQCVIKAGASIERLTREARVLRFLAGISLAVPELLAGPVALADPNEVGAIMLLSELPGHSLPWCGVTSLVEADLACRLLIQGVVRLHGLTEPVRRHPIATTLPRVTLSSELGEIVQRGGEWFSVKPFAEAIDRLQRVVAGVEVPLVFSNGDYNPLNFLCEAGALTGWVDFEGACFEDPHIGFAKFQLWRLDEYGWGTGMKAGLIERYLYAQGVSRREFAPRLVLRCLRHLQQEVSVGGEEDATQREHLLNVLAEGLSTFNP